MKTLCIVTDGETTLERFLKENIKMVFGDCLQINTFYFKDLKEGDIIEDDLILVMVDDRALAIKKHVEDSKKIVVINRTILESEIYKLFLIPKDTNVLVVNDNKETILEMIYLLYGIGINHLKLIPYEKGKEYKDIEIAITPGEINRIPKYIKKKIDLGHRHIDMSTFLTIINRLDIDEQEISKKLIEYSEKVIGLNTGIKDQYKSLYTKNKDFDMIINLSKDGILLTSEDGNITIYNDSLKKMFHIREDLRNCKVNKIFKGELSYLVDANYFNDEIVKYENRYLNINKRQIKHFGRKKGEYYNIQEITYIKKLEQDLSSRLREKGQIAKYTFKDIKTKSDSMKDCIRLAKKTVDSNLTVLITGESGTGKEMLSQSIHTASNRKNQPFVAINCAAIPENLLESELFGYVDGAFTGALKEGKIGVFEQANNGTIFLDEIGDMPIQLQTRLLRVLEERQVMRIGSNKIIEIDIRVIAATNQDLIKNVEEKKFRSDLFYRLNVLPINIPPLRKRKEDIIPLFNFFVDEKIKLEESAKDILKSHDWAGNIRELNNISSYLQLICEDNLVEVKDLPHYLLSMDKNLMDIDDKIIELIKSEMPLRVLEIIYNYGIKGESIGRYKIHEIMINNGFIVTEGEIRGILSELKLMKLISSNIGRGGSKITDKGNYLIENIKEII